MGEGGPRAHRAPSRDLEVQPATRGLACIERCGQAQRCARGRVPLADVRDLHAGQSSQRSWHAAQCPDVPRLQRKSFSTPDQVRKFTLGRVDIVNLDETSIGRFIWEPGWRWSEVVKPVVDTPLCVNRHLGYAIGGHLHVLMEDGTELDIVAGDAYEIPPGHDAWVDRRHGV